MGLDLDAIRAIIDGYEARKKNAREWHIKNDFPADEDHISLLASFRTDEAVKAFEALRPLVERVRVLERTLERLEGFDLAVCSCWDCPARGTCEDIDKPCFSVLVDYIKREAQNACQS